MGFHIYLSLKALLFLALHCLWGWGSLQCHKLYGFSQSRNCPYKAARQGGGGRNVSSKKSQTLPKLTSQARLLPCPGFSLFYKLTWRISLSWPTKCREMDVLQRPNKSYWQKTTNHIDGKQQIHFKCSRSHIHQAGFLLLWQTALPPLSVPQTNRSRETFHVAINFCHFRFFEVFCL